MGRQSLIIVLVLVLLPYPLLASQGYPGEGGLRSETGAGEGIQSDKHHLRTVLELTAVLGLTAALYYSPEGRKRNENDWEYPFTWDTFRKKVFFDDTVRFDNNAADINLGHVGAGTAYYLIARSNGLNAAESFAYTFGASSLWEILGEIREVYSINDQVVTSVGGLVFGETLYQLGRYLRFGPKRSPLRNFLASVLDPATAFNGWLNGFSSFGERDKQGRAGGIRQGRFELYGATVFLEEAKESVGAAAVGLETEVRKIPRWERPGEARTFYSDTVLTATRIEYSGNRKKNPNDFLLRAKTIFGGFRLKDLSVGESGEGAGYDFLIGPASALHMQVVNRPDGGGWIADFQVIGPALEAAFFYEGWRFRLSADLYGDFAMIQSKALKEFKRIYGSEGLAGIQQKEGDRYYYYGLGLSESLGLSAAYGPVEIGAWLRRSDFRDIRGRDLLEEKITRRPNLWDTQIEMELRAVLTLDEEWALEAYLNRARRACRADDIRFSEREISYGLRLRFFFS